MDLRAPALRLCEASPTYEAWRSDLVAALGRTSQIIKASDLRSRHEQSITWCKGDDLARLLGGYKVTTTMGRRR